MTQTDTASALDIQNVSYSYRGHWLIKRNDVLKNISLSIASGESFGFLGHNGAGKTTTIKSILGINKIRNGAISVFGIEHRQAAARGMIGYLPEQPYFYDHLSVREILSLYATLSGIPQREIGQACGHALELVKLTGREHSRLRSLSKGLVQRVGMAQAIIASPRLLILDEPFSGLDPIGRKDFRELLLYLKGIGTTIFMSSHILGDVEFLCDRVSIMSKGEIKGVFAVRDLPTQSSVRYELLVEESDASRSAILPLMENARLENGKVVGTFTSRERADEALRAAIGAHIRIDSFSTVQDSLEDIFVKLVQFDESKGA